MSRGREAVMEKQPCIIAVCGKGGVGKTSVSALLTRIFTEDTSRRVMAIDADPAEGLSYPLGITVKTTVDDVRNEFIRRVESGGVSGKDALLKQLDYEMFEALEEKNNLAFLAIGRPESEGCYCQVNNLLKDIIREIAFNFDYVIIDGEAGVEQINRRVMEMVTHLLLISDASAKGRNVVATIRKVAMKTGPIKSVGMIFNRIKNEKEAMRVMSLTDQKVLGWIPESETLREFDREGKSFYDLPDGITISSLKNIVENLLKSHSSESIV